MTGSSLSALNRADQHQSLTDYISAAVEARLDREAPWRALVEAQLQKEESK